MAKCDMFLKLDGAKSGTVKGEASDAVHSEEIEVADWSWGMSSGHAIGGAGPTAKTALSELRIVKRVDAASTALMSVMRNNEQVKKAVLTVRKAGDQPVEYLIVKIERGRITTYEVASESAIGPELTERIAIAFESIEIEYRAQDTKGGRKGGSMFSTDVR